MTWYIRFILVQQNLTIKPITLRFSDVFRGYRKGTLAWNGLILARLSLAFCDEISLKKMSWFFVGHHSYFRKQIICATKLLLPFHLHTQCNAALWLTHYDAVADNKPLKIPLFAIILTFNFMKQNISFSQ